MRSRRALSLSVLLACAALAALAPGLALAAPYGVKNRPEDDWKVVETTHFRVYFTDDTRRTAARVVEIIEDTYARLNAFYHYQPPGKIGITVVGYTTYSNGFADFSRNKITIFTTPMDSRSRSRVPWLEGVLTHELSHILSLNAGSALYSRMPLVLGTGVVRTNDGQAMARLPLYAHNYPHWLAEGVAQFDTWLLGRDGYDENRRALQRAAFEDRLLYPLEKLAFFGGEQWYNTGFSFLQFLEEKFGEGTVHRLLRAAGERYDYVFDWLLPRVLGRSQSELEAEFRAAVEQRYREHRARAAHGLYDGKPVLLEGQDRPYLELTPSQRDYQREGYAALPLRYLDGKLFYRQSDAINVGTFSPEKRAVTDVEPLAEGVAVAGNGGHGYLVLRPDDTRSSLIPYVYHPKLESLTLLWTNEDGDERVLADESRLSDLDTCLARSELAAVYDDGDGSVRLALFRLEHAGTPEVALAHGGPRFPLPTRDFDEIRSPRYSPDCRTLYFSRRTGQDHDLLALDLESGAVRAISAETAFELYPAPTSDGVYYVSARDGAMNVMFAPSAGGPHVVVTKAVTSHHQPVVTPTGLVFGRLYGTGFQLHYQDVGWRAGELVEPEPTAKAFAAGGTSDAYQARLAGADDYAPLSARDLMAPTLVPMLDLELDATNSPYTPLSAQAGLELYVEDQLSQHALLLRGLLGNRNSGVVDYSNRMTELTLRARFGLTTSRDLYTYAGEDARYQHVTSYTWGFAYAGATWPLSAFHYLTASAETTRDLSATVSARPREYSFEEPRYGRELYGLRYEYLGIDRSDPTFRERDINKRGYRTLTLGAFYGVDHVHASIAQYDQSLREGQSGYFRADLNHAEYIALPPLMNGFYDHSLELGLSLGYISRDIAFLPFMGGGQLYALSSPEYNTSVGFVGYPFYSVRGETLANLAVTYRGPIARRLGLDWGPLYLEDIYFQVFTSWGNIWSFDRDGSRQIPFVDRAANGRRVLGDVGFDLRLGNFFQEAETNVGTTLRVVYRVVPFGSCPDRDPQDDCLEITGSRGLLFYAMVGAGF